MDGEDGEAGPSTPRRSNNNGQAQMAHLNGHGPMRSANHVTNGSDEVDRASTPTGAPRTAAAAALRASPNGHHSSSNEEADLLTPTKIAVGVAAPALNGTISVAAIPSAQKRAARVEASWEDVESDEEETTARRRLSVDDKEDAWEDDEEEEEEEEDGEESDEDEESESGLSNVTESASRQQHEEHLRRRKAEGSSGRRALREYRKSRKALLLSGFSPWEHSYEDEEEVHADADSLRVPRKAEQRHGSEESDEMLAHHDPYSAIPGTEAVDAAEPAGRAHEVSLSPLKGNHDDDDKENIESMPSSGRDSRRTSSGAGQGAEGSKSHLGTPAHSKRPSLSPKSSATLSTPTLRRRSQPRLAQSLSVQSADDRQSPSGRRLSKDRGRNEQIRDIHSTGPPSTPRVKDNYDTNQGDEADQNSREVQEMRRGSSVSVQGTPMAKIVALGSAAISSAVGYATGATPARASASIDTIFGKGEETAGGDNKMKLDDSRSQPAQQPSTSASKSDSAAARQARASQDAKMAKLLAARLDELAEAAPPFSLWDYLKEEVMATDFDSTQEMKWERVTNFIAIPFWMEKIILFGFAVCLDSFLYTFTILPLRFLVAFYLWTRNMLVWITGGPRRYLSSSHKCDMLKTILVVLSCYILSRATDASKMYHSVRGQDVVKLYVIFNVLEIADRLCCSFGQDLLDSLFSRSTLARRKDGSQPFLRPLGFFVLSLGYILAHTLVLFYQLVTLNVAINSYDNALLTLLLSNQFVEIKGSVFKKFEKENLFQLTCADIVERFQLTLMLSAIGLRNLIEVSGAAATSVSPSGAGQFGVPSSGAPSSYAASTIMSGANLSGSAAINNSGRASSGVGSNFGATLLGPLPTSFTVFPSFSLLETAFAPVGIVLGSECLVDWLKHAFITKFNHIRPAVYGRFMDVLCRDLVVTGSSAGSSNARARKHTFVDQSPIVSRRLGFAALPLACMLVRITLQMIGMVGDDSHFDECAVPPAPSSTAGDDTMEVAFAIRVLRILKATTALILRNVFMVQEPERVMERTAQLVVSTAAWALTIFIAWVFLVALKLLLGTNLVSFASHRYASAQRKEREREEELNARDRAPIGIDKETIRYEAELGALINNTNEDDATARGASSGMGAGTLSSSTAGQGQGKKEFSKGPNLIDVNRYSMIKSRIW